MEPSDNGSQLKRQRTPLSDSEDNIFPSSEGNDGQKRRRLDRNDRENRSPPPSCGRLAELALKPDTPAIHSVRSRVQQLTQRREGGPALTQRCLSDPGADSLSVILNDKGFSEHLLSEEEFHQRLERFKAPVFGASQALAPSGSCPRTCSDFVSGIQQKLQGSLTPSSKLVSLIRQEREQELRLLRAQPISENAWLKRSSSDPSISEVDDGANLEDGSLSETPASTSDKKPLNGTGEKAPPDSPGGPTFYVELDSCSEWREQMERREPESSKEKEQEGSVSGGEVLGSRQNPHQITSEPSADGAQSGLESPLGESPEMRETLKTTQNRGSEVFLSEEIEERGDSSHDEEEMELTTDEELRPWRYPQHGDHGKLEVSVVAVEQQGEAEWESSAGEEINAKQHGAHSEVHDGDSVPILAEVSRFADAQGSEEHIESIPKDEYIESKISPLVESLKNEKAIEHSSIDGLYGGLEPRCKDPTQTVDMVTQTGNLKQEENDLEFKTTATHCSWETTEQRGSEKGDPILHGVEYSPELREAVPDMAPPMEQDSVSYADAKDGAQTLTGVKEADEQRGEGETEPGTPDRGHGVPDELARKTQMEALHQPKRGEGGGQKKVTFILEPELINDSILSDANTSCESRAESSFSGELSSHDETNTAEMIDQMFEEVLEYAGRIEEEKCDGEDTEDRDSGIGNFTGDKDKMDTESEKERSKEEEEDGEEGRSLELDTSGEELLTFPSSGILSPLSKSVEAVVTPLRLAVNKVSNPPSLPPSFSAELTTTPPADSTPLYSIDAYRTQRQRKLPTIQSVTPRIQRRAPDNSRPPPSINTKEKIAALTDEASKLQTVITQTLQALSCCTDEEHGRGSLEEAEAEKLLLVSCEKRNALLAEVTRLRNERSLESEETAGAEGDYISQQPCRGTVTISNVRLPLKVEFVCSSRNRTGRPSHYFFILIRYGPCNIVATPLATAADAKNGDTISFSTSVTLKDIRSVFQIDVEVYSLSHTSGNTCSVERTFTKSRVTPRKLLSTITHRSNNSLTAPAPPSLNTRRSSNFCLVGSHKITLASLGQTKFPLDKMKFDGKVRRLLGDEFQEKVPFLSPLEGNIYLCLDSESHSYVQHQGFLTMFEVVNGFGAWHRRFFALEGYHMHYWNHPNDKETKAAEGSISLSSSASQCVKPVKRDSCARPFTFELVSNVQTQQEDDCQETIAKCWFSSDTKQERWDWMEKLNQALLDVHTWNQPPRAQSEPSQARPSASGSLRESML